ncbi:MAG: cytochrome c [Bacteroidales bacterium]|nr:cytochrome c [Bacteroidales bacterium]
MINRLYKYDKNYFLFFTGRFSGVQQRGKNTDTAYDEQNGIALYKKYCLACHQANGQGVPGMYPPIANTNWVYGNKETLIKTVLVGISGPIEVNGEPYNNVMPGHKMLSDKQMADLLTYVRKTLTIMPVPLLQKRSNRFVHH